MPTISKTDQRPKAPPGSILSRAVPVAKMPTTPIKMLVYGANRVGKTSLAVQFPKPFLLVSFEPARSGGATSVKKVPGVDMVHVTDTLEAEKLAEELASDTHYKSHGLDTATSLQDLVLKEILGRSKPLEQITRGMVSDDQYRKRSERCKELLRLFLDLPAHTIVCGKEKDHKPLGEKTLEARMVRQIRQESFFSVDLGGGTAGWLQDSCDYVTRLSVEKEVITVTHRDEIQGQVQETTEEKETGEIVRRLRCRYHPNYAAGFRAEDPKRVPEYVEGKTPEELYRKVMQVIRGEYKVTASGG